MAKNFLTVETAVRAAVFGILLFCRGARGAEPSREPERPPPARAAKELIRDLGAPGFDVREKATKDLIARGLEVLPDVEEALIRSKDLEVKARLQSVIDFLPALQEERERSIEDADEALAGLEEALTDRRLDKTGLWPGARDAVREFRDNANVAAALTMEDHPDVEPAMNALDENFEAVSGEGATLEEIQARLGYFKKAWTEIKKAAAARAPKDKKRVTVQIAGDWVSAKVGDPLKWGVRIVNGQEEAVVLARFIAGSEAGNRFPARTFEVIGPDGESEIFSDDETCRGIGRREDFLEEVAAGKPFDPFGKSDPPSHPFAGWKPRQSGIHHMRFVYDPTSRRERDGAAAAVRENGGDEARKKLERLYDRKIVSRWVTFEVDEKHSAGDNGERKASPAPDAP